MRSVSLNAWGGRLHDRPLPWLAEAAPDTACIRPVVHGPASPREWLTYRDGDHVLPQRADFLRDLRTALPDRIAILCPAAQGRLWDVDRPVRP